MPVTRPPQPSGELAVINGEAPKGRFGHQGGPALFCDFVEKKLRLHGHSSTLWSFAVITGDVPTCMGRTQAEICP